MQCQKCGGETKNPKFCSNSCAASFNNRIYPKRKCERVCKRNGCEKPVHTYKNQICTEHLREYREGKYRNKTIGEYRNLLSVRGKHRSWVSAHVRNFAREWNKELRKMPCRNCGYSKHVELCHRKAISGFPDETPLRVINSAENIYVLCRNCHWEFDHGHLTLQ